ncbi:hypothetical protein L0337_03375 [candidate division KSB1 bacterium]|nr:hypothetical protein [candidate division KSB1 bacterium]
MASSKPYSEQVTTPEQPNKVAEAVSPYLAPTETRRSVLPKKVEPPAIAGLPASEEVWRFAQENALAPHIETAVRLVRGLFKEIQSIKLEYGVDPEIPNWDSIDIHFYVTGTMEELLQTDQKFTRAFVAAVPDEPRSKICPLLWATVIN